MSGSILERTALYRSSDEGATWTRFGPTGGIYEYARPTLVTPEGGIFIATSDRGGIFCSTDDGLTWARRAEGVLSVHPRFMTRTPTGSILLATDSGLYRSTNNGDQWAFVGFERVEVGVPAVAPDGTVYLPTRFDSLFRSSDDGQTWLGIHRGPVGTIILADGAEIIASIDNGIHRSVDSGRSFAPFALTGLRRTLWAGRLPEGDLIAAVRDSAMMFRSTDSGISWDLLAIPTRCTEYGMRFVDGGNGELLAGTGCGIFRSTDTGSTWRLHLPLPQNEGSGELLVDSRGALWFGGRSGIYTTAQPSRVLAASGEDAGTMSPAIYPNPGSGQAQIVFTLPTTGNVTLSLRTLPGETIMMVHDGPLPAGDHTFRIDHALPAGMYLIHLRAGEQAASTMMHVVK